MRAVPPAQTGPVLAAALEQETVRILLRLLLNTLCVAWQKSRRLVMRALAYLLVS